MSRPDLVEVAPGVPKHDVEDAFEIIMAVEGNAYDTPLVSERPH